MFIIKMESKEGSVKRLIRVHLNAHKKSILQRRNNDLNPKNTTNPQIRKVTFKSPEILIKLIHR